MTSNLEGDPSGAFRIQIDRVNLILFDEYYTAQRHKITGSWGNYQSLQATQSRIRWT